MSEGKWSNYQVIDVCNDCGKVPEHNKKFDRCCQHCGSMSIGEGVVRRRYIDKTSIFSPTIHRIFNGFEVKHLLNKEG